MNTARRLTGLSRRRRRGVGPLAPPAREDSSAQLGGAGGAGVAGHCGRYPGIPPPPRGLPPPLRPYRQHFSAGMPGGGPPGSWWKAGVDGGVFNAVALTTPNPLVTVDRTTPAAITAAAVKCFGFIVRVPPRTRTTLVASCLVGYAEDHQQRTRRCRLAESIVKNPSLYVMRTYCEDRTKRYPQVRSQPDPKADQPRSAASGASSTSVSVVR